MVVERKRHDVGGPGESRIRARRVAGVPVEADIARNLAGQQRRASRTRRGGGRHRRQCVVIDLDQLGRIKRLRVRLGHDQCQRLAGEAYFFLCQQRLRREGKGLAGLNVGLGVGSEWFQPVGRRIGRGQHGQHARRTFGYCCMNGADQCMGMRRAQDHGVRRSVEPQIVQVRALAGDETRILAASGRCAHPVDRHVRKVSAFFACRFSSHQSRA